jgi:hypothetical protein
VTEEIVDAFMQVRKMEVLAGKKWVHDYGLNKWRMQLVRLIVLG